MSANLLSRVRIASTAWRYGLATVLSGLALALALPTDAPSSCFLLAVMASSLVAGKGPGILSIGLSAFCFDYFFVKPQYRLSIDTAESVRFAVFLSALILVAVLTEAKRRADEARHAGERHFREIVESIHGLIAVMTPQGEVELVNRQVLEYFGHSLHELKAWAMTAAIHPDDLPLVVARWTHSIQAGEPYDVEHRIRRHDGVYRWFQVRALPVRDAGGHILRWYSLLTDIDDRRKAEDALRASELNFRLIVDSIPGLVSTMTRSGEAESVNRQVMEYTGKTAEEMKDWLPTIHPDDRALVSERWRKAVETGQLYEVEERIQRADGVYRWFHARGLPLRDAQGAIVRWYILLTDVEDRKRAEEAVRESELNFRLTVDSIPGLVHTMSAAGQPEFVNQQVLDFFGKTQEELSNWVSLVHPEDRDRVVALWGNAVETGHAFEAELRVQRADGVYRWLQSRGLPLREASGRIVRWYNLLTDIDDRRQAEEALRASELNFRLMVHSIPGFLNTNTPTGEVEVANQTLLSYTGKSVEELKNWTAIVHPGDLPAVSNLWARSVETGQPLDAEFRIRRADGVFRWFHARALPMRDDTSRIVRWYTLLTDIEDRWIAEDALRASERELSLIIEMIPGLVWCASPTGDLTYVNQQVLDYMGTPLDTLTQDGWTRFLHPDDFETTLRAWSHAVATGQKHEIQYRLRRSDGAYRWFHALGQPLRDSEGTLVRWYGLLIDTDDRKCMEEALRDTQARLSRATQIATVGELAASIAHEINQPLAAVVANGHACVRWLTAESPSPAKAREAAERIVRDGKEAGEVVRRIRALFRRAAPEKATIDLNEVIGEVLDLLGGETRKRRVAVEMDLEATLPPVTGDRVQLQQLVLNLVVNGLDAMDAVSESSRKLSLRSTRHREHNALVEIQDRGVGLRDPDKVFEAFFTTKEHGMGMGLTICRSIVEAHGGHLWASSAEGPGAVFRFTLPLTVSTPV